MIPSQTLSAPPASPAKQGSPGTREALMDATESLLAQRGVAETSARDITKLAGANLGAINYHFGSKDNLVLEVFARRLRPLNQERLARLDALEKAAGRRPLKLDKIMEALIRPIVEAQECRAQEYAVLQLICRGFQEANSTVKTFVEREYAEISRRFDAAILKAVPHLPAQELYWRMKFFGGAMHHGMDAWSRFDQMPMPNPEIHPSRLDREGFIQRLISFVTAGISAPLRPLS